MFSPLLVGLLLAALLGLTSAKVLRRGEGYGIIGGEPAKITELPHQAYVEIEKYGGTFTCGGSVISPRHILTAAHCVDKFDRVFVILGTEDLRGGGQIFHTSDVRVHENYEKSESNNEFTSVCDIAVLSLTRKIAFSDKIQMIDLAQPGVEVEDGTELVISGWGGTDKKREVYPDLLRKLSVPKVNFEECYEIHIARHSIVDENTICAGGEPGKAAFNGDSGGALIVETGEGNLQVGIDSWGNDDDGFPDVYTDVSKFYNWIMDSIAQDMKAENGSAITDKYI